MAARGLSSKLGEIVALHSEEIGANLAGNGAEKRQELSSGEDSKPLLSVSSESARASASRSLSKGAASRGKAASRQNGSRMRWRQSSGVQPARLKPNAERLRESGAARRWPLGLLFLLVACFLALACGQFRQAQAQQAQGHKQQQPASPPSMMTSSTVSSSDEIKWSFGGWAPLNGKPGPHGAHNATRQQAPGGRNGATSPLPVLRGANVTEASWTQRRGQAAGGQETLSESASIARGDKLQYAVAANAPSRLAQQQQQQHASSARPTLSMTAPYQQAHELRSAASQQRPTHHTHAAGQFSAQLVGQYSPVAPPPIVREHLLAPPPRPHPMGQGPQEGARHPGRPHGPKMEELARMRHMEQRHREHMARHQHMMQQHMQQAMHHQHHHQQQQQQQQQASAQHRQPRVRMHQMVHGGAHQMVHGPPVAVQLPRVPPSSLPHVGAFKVLDDGQPIMFSAPLGPPEQHQLQANQQRARNATHAMNLSAPKQQLAGPVQPPMSSAMHAIEKDNLNYNEAMRQVAKSLAEEGVQPAARAQPSNNIQEVKQKQLGAAEQQQQQQQRPAPPAQPVEAKAAGQYLTIPVAVETEGDKVLTADEINEIEKHVINVLPNLKTADKLAELADAQLAAGSKASQQGHQGPQQAAHAQAAPSGAVQELHKAHYEEHRSTMAALQADLGQQHAQQQHEAHHAHQQVQQHQVQAHHAQDNPQQQQQHAQHAQQAQYAAGSPPPAHQSSQPSSAAPQLQHQQQASTASAHHQEAPQHHNQNQNQNQNSLDEHQQYFIATGPMQELGTMDADQLGDYNVINNELLSNFHYEPTRANHQQQHQQQQTASTPPMPYTATDGHTSSPHRQTASTHQQQQHPQTATVTRYFHQGQQGQQQQQQQSSGPMQAYQQERARGGQQQLFGRLRVPTTPAHYGPSSGSTRTILGGRKVSEVMRPLIQTTPVPMTSPMHVSSVEPEKVDAIQLIAGQANDRQPMVVEAHQLVSHTPDGGIDYSTGMGPAPAQAPAHSNHSAGQQQHYGQTSGAAHEQQGAIIEYVTLGVPEQQSRTGPQRDFPPQAYEMQPATPEAQPVYVAQAEHQLEEQQMNHHMSQQQQAHQQAHQQAQNQQQSQSQAPLIYAYTMSAQAEQAAHESPSSAAMQANSAGASGNPNAEQPKQTTVLVVHSQQDEQQQQQQQLHQQQHLQQPLHQQQPAAIAVWSPSVASEHQQQQLELMGNEAPPMADHMPSTAGYNFFGQAMEQQQESPASYEQKQQQHQAHQEQAHHSQWRTKAGGRQPNPGKFDVHFSTDCVLASWFAGDCVSQSASRANPLDTQQRETIESEHPKGSSLQLLSCSSKDAQTEAQELGQTCAHLNLVLSFSLDLIGELGENQLGWPLVRSNKRERGASVASVFADCWLICCRLTAHKQLVYTQSGTKWCHP